MGTFNNDNTFNEYHFQKQLNNIIQNAIEDHYDLDESKNKSKNLSSFFPPLNWSNCSFLFDFSLFFYIFSSFFFSNQSTFFENLINELKKKHMTENLMIWYSLNQLQFRHKENAWILKFANFVTLILFVLFLLIY